jgi:P27 family predicted phage terminase small subunit
VGRRGPKSIPIEAHRARKTYRADRHGDCEISPAVPVRPKWLSAAARAEWKRLVEELVAAGIVGKIDATVLALCCQRFADYLELRDQVAATGSIAVAESGAPYQHPLVGMMHKALDQWLRLAQQLGLTPSARCGMKIEKRESGPAVPVRKRA